MSTVHCTNPRCTKELPDLLAVRACLTIAQEIAPGLKAILTPLGPHVSQSALERLQASYSPSEIWPTSRPVSQHEAQAQQSTIPLRAAQSLQTDQRGPACGITILKPMIAFEPWQSTIRSHASILLITLKPVSTSFVGGHWRKVRSLK